MRDLKTKKAKQIIASVGSKLLPALHMVVSALSCFSRRKYDRTGLGEVFVVDVEGVNDLW